MTDDQFSLFDEPPDWIEQWAGMPEFEQKDLRPFQTVKVHFRNREDRDAFGKIIGHTFSDSSTSAWYPKAQRADFDKLGRFVSATAPLPRYPIYIVSKGRADSRLTSRALESMGVPYRIVVEPQEFDVYVSAVGADKVLRLPFGNLGQGSIPARNWIWEHAISEGFRRHWIIDDNIRFFARLTNNRKYPVQSGAVFSAAEDFVDRFDNVALAGFEYHGFAPAIAERVPFVLNRRIYSCTLIDNAIAERWRGRYNEDTDLSLRVLKSGLCTVLFVAFLAHKETTMSMRGGNTDELYQGDGRRQMAESLRAQHPDCVRIVHKWGRWQHSVNYRPFRANKLIRSDGASLPAGANNYGMELTDVSAAWRRE